MARRGKKARCKEKKGRPTSPSPQQPLRHQDCRGSNTSSLGTELSSELQETHRRGQLKLSGLRRWPERTEHYGFSCVVAYLLFRLLQSQE